MKDNVRVEVKDKAELEIQKNDDEELQVELLREDGCSKLQTTKDEKGIEDVLKELKKVKKQNSITHLLLSIMIVLTTTWQISEVSLILILKNKFTNPFKSFGDMVSGAIKGSGANALLDKHDHTPSLQIPEIPHIDLCLDVVGGKND
ncbi:hypothetical protein GIB67_009367 [Kingdonia uniflora]|uniref:Uncharacterized protein n=1 Tax=Kingdonia uniflora TaxID=39325 RepID=A0A7J7N3K7_9MAGN|nr:hypothetical protein GIB67_009367 [Kingdonia uniflora]